MTRALWRLAPLVLALPVLAGAGVCGVVLYDISQRALVLDPVEQLRFRSDSGSFEAYSFDRTAVSLFYYLVGSEFDIGDVGHRVDGDVLDVFVVCDRPTYCNANYYVEVPRGTALDVETRNGPVKLVRTDADVVADVTGGGVTGIDLRTPVLDLVVAAGDVTLNFQDPPDAVRIAVGEGAVDITLPAGTYRCELAAEDGTVDVIDVTCDPDATALLEIDVAIGDIAVKGVTP